MEGGGGGRNGRRRRGKKLRGKKEQKEEGVGKGKVLHVHVGHWNTFILHKLLIAHN